MKEPQLSVGILAETEIDFVLLTPFRVNGVEVTGKQTVTYSNGKVQWQGNLYHELLFEPTGNASSEFEIVDVTIGINFHWERKEHQRFEGAFRIIVEDNRLRGINVVAIERYLTSVISSEMSANASLELLKAHAVISRSWVLRRLADPHKEHDHFDVCADDHCQRYQGTTRASTPLVEQAIKESYGLTLTYEGEVCDTRYSKCCGGALERFSTCWEEIDYPYLNKKRDSFTETTLPDLTIEKEAERWINTTPESFCNTTDGKVLAQVLNNYDQETTNFYRWKVEYTQQELSELVHKRSGIDFGEITELIPLARGTSGRIYQLKIVGSKQTKVIGKELVIRRVLSTSHLYSSAFNVSFLPEQKLFRLTGAGWGHGVGLCQIGAAVMGEKGYKYPEILLHYYPGATLEKRYDEAAQ